MDKMDYLPEPSLHQIARKAAIEGWKQIRQLLLKATVENNGMAPDEVCILCNAQASCRCLQCAPWAYYCCGCIRKAHSRVNIFHSLEMIWEVF